MRRTSIQVLFGQFAIGLGISASASAAVLDVDFMQLRDTPLGRSLLRELRLEIPNNDVDVGAHLERLRLLWHGPDSPVTIDAIGLPDQPLRAAIASAPKPTPLGDAMPLPGDRRYAIVPMTANAVLIATDAGIADYKTPRPLAARAEKEAFAFTGDPSDVNLAEYCDRVPDFGLTMTSDGLLVGTINCKDREAAHGLMAYIANRVPILNLLAATGFEKVQFPKRMVDAAVIERHGRVITITADLRRDRALRDEAYDFLISTFRRVMRKSP